MKKVLIIYGSIGLGHKVVAENIAAALRDYPEVEVEMLDVLRLYEGRLTKESSKIYEWIIKHAPRLWGFFYTNWVFQKFALPLRIPFAGMKAKKFKNYISKSKPDLILTTHPNATALAAYLKKSGKYSGPLVTTFSDFHFQPFWVYPGVARYLVMTAEQREEVIRRGFAKQRIVVTGLPIDPGFGKTIEESAVYKKYGLSHTKPLVLVMGGSRGWGIKLSDIDTLLDSALDFQIAVVTGNNPELERELKVLAEKFPESLKVFGEWSNESVAELFSIAKLLVTKPGGLTIAQALLKSLPMVLVNPLPTMEELNLAYVVARGAGLYARNSRELRSWVERLLQDKKFYQKVRKNARELAVPQAAKLAAKAIIDML